MIACNLCQIPLKRKVTGVKWIEKTDSGVPHAIWNADIRYCPLCNIKIVHTADTPYMEFSHRDFKSLVKQIERRENDDKS